MAVNTKPKLVDDAALSVRGLTVDLPKGMERAHAVENISFDLKRGQILCIIGESRFRQVGDGKYDHGALAEGNPRLVGLHSS